MLQTMRDNAQGIVAKVIVGLIIIVFALFGVESIVSLGGGEKPAIKVGDIEVMNAEIEQRILDQKNDLRQRFGESFDEGLFSEDFLRDSAIEQLINEKVMLSEVQNLDLHASAAAIDTIITTNPAFQVNGVFDKDQFVTLLNMNRYTVLQYRTELAERIKMSQAQAAISLPTISTPFAQQYQQALAAEERTFSYVEVNAADFEADLSATEEELQAYYDANIQGFQNPEKVKIQYLLLDKESLQSEQDVSEENIELAYQDYLAELAAAEQRQVSHILFDGTEHSESEAIELAEAALARINQGESFAVVASEVSEDGGSALDGGALGINPRGTFDPAFEEALYALEEGQVSAPVVTEYGVHLIRADKIIVEDAVSKEDMREELIQIVSADLVDAMFAEQAQELANLAFSSSSIDELAEVANLSIQEEGYFTARQGLGIAANGKIRLEAFKDNMKLDKEVSSLIETEQGALVFAVSDYQEASAKPLAEVEDIVKARVISEKSLAAAKVAAEGMKAGTTADWMTATESIQQQSQTQPAVKRLAFGLKDGETDLVKIPAGYAVVKVDSVTRVNWSDIAADDLDLDANANQLARQDMMSYQAWAKANTKIER